MYLHRELRRVPARQPGGRFLEPLDQTPGTLEIDQVAELDGLTVAFRMATVYYGEFGVLRFFQAEGFSMAPRLRLERRLD